MCYIDLAIERHQRWILCSNIPSATKTNRIGIREVTLATKKKISCQGSVIT